jgi:thiamine biosynthesis lipoprotein
VERFEFAAPSMGTMLKLVVYAESESRATLAIDAALTEIDRLIPILNNYDPTSEVSRLPGSVGTPQTISPDLAAVLREARRWHRLSEGGFDITIGPVTQLWAHARRETRLPDPEEWQRARARCGWEHVEVEFTSDPEGVNQVTLKLPAMRLDVGGIATGYILDRACEAIERTGHESYLLDIGGDIRVGTSPPNLAGWRVDIGGMGKESPPLLRLELQQCAVTTSGDLNQFVEIDGERYSHLIDPRCFAPLQRRQSVTAIANTALDADAGATTLCLWGMKGAAWIDGLPVQEAFFLETDPSGSAPPDATPRFRHVKHAP